MIVLIAMGWAANFSLLSARLDEIRRRTEILEHEIVPRSEHIMREEQLNKRLDTMEDQIRNVQQTANQISLQLAVQKIQTDKHP